MSHYLREVDWRVHFKSKGIVKEFIYLLSGLSLDNIDSFLGSLSNAKIDHFIKSTSSQKSAVQQIWAVSGSNNKHASFLPQSIDFSQQLGHYAVHDLAWIGPLASRRCQRVQFIEEYYAWKVFPGPFKHLSHIFLRLPHIHIQQFGPFHWYKVHLALCSYRFRQECLASPWRPIEQQPRSLCHPVYMNECQNAYITYSWISEASQ